MRTLAFVQRTVVAGVLAALCVGLAGCSHVPGVYTYVPAGQAEADGGASGGALDPKAFVEGIWSSKVLPTVEEKAVEAATLLPALAADQTAASTTYGHQAGTGSPFAFLIKGSGSVTAVDAEVPTRPMTVQVDGVPGKGTTVQIVTGTVIAGTALRDAVGFISFNDFKNQLDYADVATALNTRVKSDVLAPLDPASLVGKRIEFAGAFSLIAPTSILVVPTSVTVSS